MKIIGNVHLYVSSQGDEVRTNTPHVREGSLVSPESLAPERGRLETSKSVRESTLFRSRFLTVTRNTRQALAEPALNRIDQLSDADRDAFLARFDPMRTLNLTGDSRLFRATEASRIVNGRMAGNPNSKALIANHFFFQDNPAIERCMRYLSRDDLSSEDHEQIRRSIAEMSPITPVQMNASELHEPSLNVMHGTDAANGVRGYSGDRPGCVTVSMKLKDFQDAGGVVFRDVSSIVDGGDLSPLLITLPKGKSVPVEIVDSR